MMQVDTLGCVYARTASVASNRKQNSRVPRQESSGTLPLFAQRFGMECAL
jgi:hypothetical protein